MLVDRVDLRRLMVTVDVVRALVIGALAVAVRVEGRDLEAANGRLQAGTLVGSELAGPAVGGWLFGVAAALSLAMKAGGLALAVLPLLAAAVVVAAVGRDG